jgi:hypothetical protein
MAKATGRCARCNASGQLTCCNPGTGRKCGACDANGKVTCRVCGGSGQQ